MKWNRISNSNSGLHRAQTLMGGSLTRHITVRLHWRTVASLLCIPVTLATCLQEGKTHTGRWSEGQSGLFLSQTEKKHFVRSCQRIPSTLVYSFSGAEELNSNPDYFNKKALNPAGKSHLEKFGVPWLLLLHQ